MTPNIESPNKTIIVNLDKNICSIKMNRPTSLNALTSEFVVALTNITESLKKNKDVRVVVIEGEGDHFMAGGDIKKFNKMIEKSSNKAELKNDFATLIKNFHKIILNLQEIPCPIIASVKGAVAGAGVSLISACDLVIAGESSFFTLAYCHIGVCPDGGSTYFLPRIIGLKRSFEIALLGDRFDAQIAEKWGLINKVVSDENLQTETEALALRLSQGPSQAYKRVKRLLQQSSQNSLSSQLNDEADAFADCTLTQDFEEGVNAFITKRPPKFTGK